MVPGFPDTKSTLAHSFRPLVKLLQLEDGTYGTFEHWTWYIESADSEGAEIWRQVIRHPKPSKKVIMPSEVAKKHFDETLGILKPERILSRTCLISFMRFSHFHLHRVCFHCLFLFKDRSYRLEP